MKPAQTEKLFEETLPLLKKIVQLHHCKYGGDVNDLMGEAQLLFLEACRTFKTDKAAFSSWLWIKVHNGLLDISKKEITRDQILRRNQETAIEDHPSAPSFCIKAFMRELSDDAKILVRVAILSGRYWRSSFVDIRSTWEPKRFEAAFTEIQNSLASK